MRVARPRTPGDRPVPRSPLRLQLKLHMPSLHPKSSFILSVAYEVSCVVPSNPEGVGNL
ncbi:hypothetical protein M407DRAFT_243399 [Tulasnella calospora MUT 4182]|uniref:Uncharacterized protein n=1 Tax=Tulasnella calospora MUT 4182 TaxID=1051891 RepID=A0A0C3QL59_9AGAM|nr:hypothetical protein M407DRAFT_243399 [Tulasnella calospora MUT 4182]